MKSVDLKNIKRRILLHQFEQIIHHFDTVALIGKAGRRGQKHDMCRRIKLTNLPRRIYDYGTGFLNER